MVMVHYHFKSSSFLLLRIRFPLGLLFLLSENYFLAFHVFWSVDDEFFPFFMLEKSLFHLHFKRKSCQVCNSRLTGCCLLVLWKCCSTVLSLALFWCEIWYPKFWFSGCHMAHTPIQSPLRDFLFIADFGQLIIVLLFLVLVFFSCLLCLGLTS